jgi:hypothetical protein
MEEILLKTLESSPMAGICILVVYWFKVQSEKNFDIYIQQTNALIGAYKENIVQLKDELKIVRDVTSKEIDSLKVKSERCESDRMDLHEEIGKIKNAASAAGFKFNKVLKLGEPEI